jgi:hypothetical protein
MGQNLGLGFWHGPPQWPSCPLAVCHSAARGRCTVDSAVAVPHTPPASTRRYRPPEIPGSASGQATHNLRIHTRHRLRPYGSPAAPSTYTTPGSPRTIRRSAQPEFRHGDIPRHLCIAAAPQHGPQTPHVRAYGRAAPSLPRAQQRREAGRHNARLTRSAATNTHTAERMASGWSVCRLRGALLQRCLLSLSLRCTALHAVVDPVCTVGLAESAWRPTAQS